ncbi:hypothetical protein [Lignipirellula cremea]|uniref:Double zinc ribbon n=1 Tax=Lignipirellula cremea TaxID=2528010 RepID=A0A518DNM3_9BACT|nr:hypothetical protein [Lignipirellula cremea]QDU93440.1 hypothetical protein Pla8534_12200 [Lignipirellula cremea]
MDPAEFQRIDDEVDKVAEAVDELLNSEAAQPLKKALADLYNSGGKRYSASLNIVVAIFDEVAERGMSLLTTGVGVSEAGEIFRTWGDSSPQRYITDGEIQVAPHNYCPRCWGEWDFKLEHRECRHCGAVMGEHVKLLLDSDVCPHCEAGKISASSPKCDQCGFEVDPKLAVWG